VRCINGLDIPHNVTCSVVKWIQMYT
jgi:hypothetical protein